MGLEDTTILWRCMVAIQFVGLGLTITGFSVRNVVGGKYIDPSQVSNPLCMGLWRAYWAVWGRDYSTEGIIRNYQLDDGWLWASKVLMGATLAAQSSVIVVTFAIVWVTAWRTARVAYITSGLSFFSAILGFIGICVFVDLAKDSVYAHIFALNEWSYYPGFGFYLFVIGQLIYVICGILHVLHGRELNSLQTSDSTGHEYQPVPKEDDTEVKGAVGGFDPNVPGPSNRSA